MQADEIDAIDIEEWIAQDLCDLSSKTMKDILSVFRMIYIFYRKRNRSAANPTDGVSISLPDDEEPDAFTRDEIGLISNTSTHRQSELNGAVFAIWTGPRPSEWLALGWDEVDLDHREVYFKRAIVERIYKATKTKRSRRSVDLLAPAVDALKRQYAITGHLPPVEIEVLQRDNRTVRKETFRPVFINTNTGNPFGAVRYFKWFWEPHLQQAGVRHRPVGMCRHSFACQMLTAGVMKSWIIEQLGHTTEAMLRKKYGRLFKRERRVNPADEVNALLNL